MRHRVGAVIVKGHRILSTGYNETTYSKHTKRPTVHAEERAVIKLLQGRRLQSLAGAEIYVSRFTKSGKCGLAAPCRRCQCLLKSVGISRAYYTTDDGTVGEMKL